MPQKIKEMRTKKNESIQSIAWPKEDEIRWVEWRVREREAIDAGKSQVWDKRGAYSLTDYRAWLLHERDSRSFQQVGEMLFKNCADPDNRKRRAYLAHDRVEGEFRRGHKKRTLGSPSFYITAFGAMPRS
jgi:hypothetical protein